ncbi:MAG: hypothetical protein K9N51_05280 [Candidatus Pacebacteria bacterium]|nr:hypothetical protein [Candidatus Paceibacterota bacterium]
MRGMIRTWMLVAMVMFCTVPAVYAQEEAPPDAEGVTEEAAGDEGELEAQVARGEEGELVSLSVNDASIQEVLRALAEMRRGVNIVIDPDVQGRMTFKLEDVEWETALTLITDAHGLEVIKEGDKIYRVSKPTKAEEESIIIELHTMQSLADLDDDTVVGMVADPTLTPAAAREKAMAAPDDYLKALTVDQRRGIDVISALARKAGLNFAFSAEAGAPAPQEPAKEGQPAEPKRVTVEDLPPISLNLHNISVRDALQLIAQQGQLSIEMKAGVWSVNPLTPEQRKAEPLVVETFQIKFIPLDGDLVGICSGLVSERGSVTAGKNKIMIVRDTEEGIEAVRKTLEVMDTPTPQVIIEARFFELQKGISKDLGIDWNVLGEDGLAVDINPITWEYTHDISEEETIDATRPLNGSFTGTVSDMREEVQEDLRSALLDVNQFGLILHALKDHTGAKQLSNPKIVVSSDQQATIHIGEQRPIVKSTVETTSAGNAIRTFELDPDYGGETQDAVQLVPGSKPTSYKTRKGYLDLGTKLTVAPSVKTENQVYIRVVPELTTFIQEETFGSGVTLTQFPLLFTTRVQTEFTIRSGQTIAIGGLVNERENTSKNEVPVLGKIPGLGRLFSYERTEKNQTETIIFLTVKVVTAEELTAVSAVPVRAYLVQPEIDRINQEDAAGATYNEENARKLLRVIEAEEAREEDEWSFLKDEKAETEEVSPASPEEESVMEEPVVE